MISVNVGQFDHKVKYYLVLYVDNIRRIHFLSNEGLPGVLRNKRTKGKYRKAQGNMTRVLGNTGI